MCVRGCACACASSGGYLCMHAQFCVYAGALPLVGVHGCTGLFADKVKLTHPPFLYLPSQHHIQMPTSSLALILR